MTMADEIKVENQSLHVQVLDSRDAIPKAYISHELLKKKILDAKAVIRTGENTPFANIILQSGVIF